jgi:regulator of nucleoside diphosphate kinase
MVSTSSHVIVTDRDLARLLPMVESTAHAASLEGELDRAIVVKQREVPPDVVTMNSRIVYEDCATGARRDVQLVYPRDADPARGRISVLAPVGSALLGLRVGQQIAWRLPAGIRCIRVVEVTYQPEAEGDFHL